MKVAFFTLGCKVNWYETQALCQLAAARGHEIVRQDADAVIINTCTVTSISDHKNIRAFHKLRRENPHAILAACGCFAQAEPEKIRQTGEIDIICGTHQRIQVIELCETAVEQKQKGQSTDIQNCIAAPSSAFEFLPAGVPMGRTRALLKIEDGCDNYCAYCIIPYMRGHVHSLPPEKIFEEIARLAETGVHEIVLTGIEIASYGRDFSPPVLLTDLLCDILQQYPMIRFRLGSLEPRIIDKHFCETLRTFSNLAFHFHLSLQSGCDTVLQRMGRRYSAEDFYQTVILLRESFPLCSITTDLIVGFPGETEEEFIETLDFLKRCAFAAVHVFPFSARKDTRAAMMSGQLSHAEKAKRAACAKEVTAKLSQNYRTHFIGRTLEVLPEHKINHFWAAHGKYGFLIYIEPTETIQKNIPVSVAITGLYLDGVQAKIIL